MPRRSTTSSPPGAGRRAGMVCERLDAYALMDAGRAAVAFGFGTTEPDRLASAIAALATAFGETFGGAKPPLAG